MAGKMRVYELAKELGKESKEVIEYLEEKGIEGKTASSALESAEVDTLKTHFSSKRNASPAAKTREDAKIGDAEKKNVSEPKKISGENSSSAPKKKKFISVFRPQNITGKLPSTMKHPAKPKRVDQRKPVRTQGQPAVTAPEREKVQPKVQQPEKKKPLTLDDIRRPDPEIMARKRERDAEAARLKAEQNRNEAKPKAQGKPEQSKTDKAKKTYRNENKPSAKGGFSGGETAAPKKGGRDAHGKERERQKDDRKTFDKNVDRSAFLNKNSKKKFNRIPKALQDNKPKEHQEAPKDVVTEIKIPEKITIRDLADRMKIASSELIKKLFLAGEIVTLNNEVDFEKAAEIALDFNIIAELEEKEDVIADLLKEDEEDAKDMVQRPPVVCVMGHVDHGKTSILDAIRNTHVIEKEAGGITQHIGAYMVSVKGRKITFLDTPGHEAFTAMRMRGANSTDIAILVVAADDGVMPQTIEAINHAKAAGVEIIIAVNKIDKPSANIERVKQELSEYELIPEDWGGQTIFCPVSAHTGEGIDDLLEMILLTADVLELKANPNRNARGLVLEAKLDKGRGPVATILIQKGTLKQGDFIACGAASGKVRAMNDENGKRVQKAGPSMPVEVVGLSDVPNAGEVLMAFDTDKEAKNFASAFVIEGKKSLLEGTQTQLSLGDLFMRIKEGSLKELPIIVKADVQGSVEAVSQSLVKLSNDEVVVKVIHSGVGAINESDVDLAGASGALIIGFNVKADPTARSTAEQNNVEINLYSVIYQIIDDISRALKGMKAAVYEEKVIGHAVVRQIFKSSGVGNIAGSYVNDGIFESDCKVRIFRGDDMIHEGALASLKRFKDNVKQVKEGFECGLVFEDFNDIEIDDRIEAYKMVEVTEE